MSNAVVVLCARQHSSRVPEKVFYPLAGVPLLDILLTRLTATGYPVVLAVPPAEGEAFRPYAHGHKVRLFTGHPDSPLHRTRDAAAACVPTADYVVRVTHDDPLI